MAETRTAQEDEINLLDILIVLLKHKKVLTGITLGAAVLSALICFIIPPTYRAETKILPPQGQMSPAMSSQLFGMISSMTGLSASALGLKNPGDLYVGMLKSRTIFDSIINRFNLMNVYHKIKFLEYHREDCLKDLGDAIEVVNGGDGIITLGVEDKDPQRATDMANAFIEELTKLNKGLAISDGARRRLFYEDQLQDAKKTLAGAEDELKAFAEKTGALQIDDQAKAVIEGIANLKAMIAAKEVEVKVMRSYTTPNNPELQKAEQGLRELKVEMNKLEAKSGSNGHDPLMPTSKMPSVATEYLRRVRDVRFSETLFQLLTSQYELAKMDEAGQAPLIQVVDKAVCPDKPVKPNIPLIVLVCTAAGFFVSLMIAFFLEYKEKVQRAPENKESIEMLKRYAGLGRKRIIDR